MKSIRSALQGLLPYSSLAIYMESANLPSYLGDSKGYGMRFWPPKQKDLEPRGLIQFKRSSAGQVGSLEGFRTSTSLEAV